MRFLTLVVLLFVAGDLSAQGAFEADRTEVSYQEGELIKKLVGRVRVEYDGMSLRADRAVYTESSGDVELVGGVSMMDSSRRLRADRVVYVAHEKRIDAMGKVFFEDANRSLRAKEILYFRETKRAKGRGDVELFDAESGTKICGGYVEYEGTDQTGFVVESPKLIRTEGERHLVITGERMEIYGRERKFVIHDRVRMRRGKFEGRCGVATYLQKRGLLELDKAPLLLYASEDSGGVQHNNEIEGQEISMRFREDVLEEIRASGQARGSWSEVDTNGDTLSAGALTGTYLRIELREERPRRMIVEEDARGWYEKQGDPGPSRIVAREIVARVEGDAFREVIAQGNVRVSLYLSEEDGTSGFSEASGDSAHVFLKSGEVERLVLEGGVEGAYRAKARGQGRVRSEQNAISDFGLPIAE